MSITTVPSHAEAGTRVRDVFGALVDFIERFGAATRVAAAVRTHRKPAVRDLKILGMEGLTNVRLDRISATAE